MVVFKWDLGSKNPPSVAGRGYGEYQLKLLAGAAAEGHQSGNTEAGQSDRGGFGRRSNTDGGETTTREGADRRGGRSTHSVGDDGANTEGAAEGQHGTTVRAPSNDNSIDVARGGRSKQREGNSAVVGDSTLGHAAGDISTNNFVTGGVVRGNVPAVTNGRGDLGPRGRGGSRIGRGGSAPRSGQRRTGRPKEGFIGVNRSNNTNTGAGEVVPDGGLGAREGNIALSEGTTDDSKSRNGDSDGFFHFLFIVGCYGYISYCRNTNQNEKLFVQVAVEPKCSMKNADPTVG